MRTLVIAAVAVAASAATASTSPPPPVTGGTEAQRKLLREIVDGFPRGTRLRRIRIEPGRKRQWPADGVAVAFTAQGRLGGWQAQVVVDAFQERSILNGLPPVVAIRTNGGQTNLWGPPGWKPPPVKPLNLPPHAEEGVEARVRAAARTIHAAPRRITVARPYGLVAQVTLHVRRAGAFLVSRRLCRFKIDAELRDLRGYFLEVRDARLAAREFVTTGLGVVTAGSTSRTGIHSPCLTPVPR